MGILDFLYKAISYKICVVYRMHSAHTEPNSINYPHIYIDIISGAVTVAVTGDCGDGDGDRGLFFYFAYGNLELKLQFDCRFKFFSLWYFNIFFLCINSRVTKKQSTYVFVIMSIHAS